MESRCPSRGWKSKRPALFFCASKEGFTMSHVIRLQWIGRVTYYVGWIVLVCGGLLHLNIATKLFLAVSLSKRNLFEISVMCFLICMASELRAHALQRFPAQSSKAED
jgi:hypothetical protein